MSQRLQHGLRAFYIHHVIAGPNLVFMLSNLPPCLLTTAHTSSVSNTSVSNVSSISRSCTQQPYGLQSSRYCSHLVKKCTALRDSAVVASAPRRAPGDRFDQTRVEVLGQVFRWEIDYTSTLRLYSKRGDGGIVRKGCLNK